jgi:hypothetical protein
LTGAIKRASKWRSLSYERSAKPMVGQVGGLSVHKKPLLTLTPDYVLKPLLTDHRGIREIAFYEAIRTISTNKKGKSKNLQQAYSNFLSGSNIINQQEQLNIKKSIKAASAVALLKQMGEWFDTFAMALAILVQDKVVIESEEELRQAWRLLKKEVNVLDKLAKFTAPYYGVIGQNGVSVMDDAHLLLQDLTVNFSQPCVMDLKLGCQTYEPDATPEKQSREFGKYPEQTEFGFRIVGMRMYDPTHQDADPKNGGFRIFGKQYGRSLKTHTDLLQALRIFFSAGIENNNADSGEQKERKDSKDDNNNDASHVNQSNIMKESGVVASKAESPDEQEQQNTIISACRASGPQIHGCTVALSCHSTRLVERGHCLIPFTSLNL